MLDRVLALLPSTFKTRSETYLWLTWIENDQIFISDKNEVIVQGEVKPGSNILTVVLDELVKSPGNLKEAELQINTLKYLLAHQTKALERERGEPICTKFKSMFDDTVKYYDDSDSDSEDSETGEEDGETVENGEETGEDGESEEYCGEYESEDEDPRRSKKYWFNRIFDHTRHGYKLNFQHTFHSLFGTWTRWLHVKSVPQDWQNWIVGWKLKRRKARQG